jgi:hypothetical protein
LKTIYFDKKNPNGNVTQNDSARAALYAFIEINPK